MNFHHFRSDRITEQQLRDEIQCIKADMATVSEAKSEYMIATLSTLLWVAGDYDRSAAFQLAREAWGPAQGRLVDRPHKRD